MDTQYILERVVDANFLVPELITSVCLSSCLENELFGEKNGVLFLYSYLAQCQPQNWEPKPRLLSEYTTVSHSSLVWGCCEGATLRAGDAPGNSPLEWISRATLTPLLGTAWTPLGSLEKNLLALPGSESQASWGHDEHHRNMDSDPGM